MYEHALRMDDDLSLSVLTAFFQVNPVLVFIEAKDGG